MTEVAVDLCQGQDHGLDQVQESVQIETESGVTNVESMTIVQTQTQIMRQTDYSNCMSQTN